MLKSVFLKINLVAMLMVVSSINGAAAKEKQIGLQHLESRTIIYCYDNAKYSAEECAEYYEKQGYVKFREIPYKIAKYDDLKVDEYPARRWRNGEITPRW